MALSWKQLGKYSWWFPPKVLIRHPGTQHLYDLHKERVKQYTTMKDYIKKKHFPDNRLHAWSFNDFPAWLEPGIDHMLLWMNPDLTFRLEDPGIVRTLITQYAPADKEFRFWENLPENRSVPGMQHFHVFIRS